MLKIDKQEYEELCIYISFMFLNLAKKTEHAFLYGKKVYIVKLDSDNSSISVSELSKSNRYDFIKEFATFSLTCMFEMCIPEENYFIFTSPKEGEYYMTTIKEEQMFVKKIKEEDLKNGN